MNRLPTLARPAAVVFDWDSTLVDNWGAIAAALNAALVAMGQAPWSVAEVRDRARSPARESFPHLFGARWRQAERIFYDRLHACQLDALRPLPGAERAIAVLADYGVPMAVVSNKAGDYLRREATALGWNDDFVSIVGANDAPRDKPAPDPVHLALAAVGTAAGPAVWFVGDSAVDLECAHAAGCTPVLVETGVVSESEIARWPPAAALASCESLADLIPDIFAERP